ncbi:PIN domain-containing protein [Alloacidobacterium dinghuense]|uniref:Ribonuclease VapC n=1 Tax=Alloacidobacterium dinghuense TaxID=2763107 RepID=A0A7G8BHT5_9BACT|nr:PIN domain-containing protein [Alloacidobacterium dinghuense]QNI32105.1 PIN domain-containing protein [Alloacidobacterium dinghuense]
MGLILDTSALIASERNGETVRQILQHVRAAHGETEVAISAITVVEFTHGIYRARTDADHKRRRAFAEEVYRDLIVRPVTLEIAQLAGQIEGEQAALGNVIPLEDLLIGATALHLGFDVLTVNVKHFQRIPALKVISF